MIASLRHLRALRVLGPVIAGCAALTGFDDANVVERIREIMFSRTESPVERWNFAR